MGRIWAFARTATVRNRRHKARKHGMLSVPSSALVVQVNCLLKGAALLSNLLNHPQKPKSLRNLKSFPKVRSPTKARIPSPEGFGFYWGSFWGGFLGLGGMLSFFERIWAFVGVSGFRGEEFFPGKRFGRSREEIRAFVGFGLRIWILLRVRVFVGRDSAFESILQI